MTKWQVLQNGAIADRKQRYYGWCENGDGTNN